MVKERYVLFIFLGAVGLLTMLFLLFHAMNTSKVNLGAGLQPVLSAKRTDNVNDYTYSVSSNTLFFRGGAADISARPLLAVLGKREYHPAAGEDTKNGIYLSFYDILQRKELSAKMIDPGADSAVDVQLRTFENGDIYFTLNRRWVYRVDRSRLEAKDVTKTLFSHQPKLKTGIEAVGFVPNNEGDGFAVLTTGGAGYAYYPLVDKLYTPDGLNAGQEGFRSLLDGGSGKVYFAFTGKGPGPMNEKPRLLRISYKDNNGGPKYICTNFNKDISAREKQIFRITDWSDLTPGRSYFDPQVVYGDAGSLLILFRADAASDAPLSLQSLDPVSGSVKWTVACSTDGKPDKALPFRDGFILVKGNTTRVLGAEGAMQGEYKLK
jgi:hypothetical protein